MLREVPVLLVTRDVNNQESCIYKKKTSNFHRQSSNARDRTDVDQTARASLQGPRRLCHSSELIL